MLSLKTNAWIHEKSLTHWFINSHVDVLMYSMQSKDLIFLIKVNVKSFILYTEEIHDPVAYAPFKLYKAIISFSWPSKE